MIDFILSYIQSVLSFTDFYWFQLLFFSYICFCAICLINYALWGRS